jgi:hypothetical protein
MPDTGPYESVMLRNDAQPTMRLYRAKSLVRLLHPRALKRMRLAASLTDAEFETVLERTRPAEVIDRAFEREARCLVRSRS